MCAATTEAGVSCWFMVSSVLGSTPWAMTTLPSGVAHAAAPKVVEGLLSRGHEPQGLRLPSPTEEAADRRPGRQMEGLHDLLTTQERGRGRGGHRLLRAGHQLAHRRPALRDPHRQ